MVLLWNVHNASASGIKASTALHGNPLVGQSDRTIGVDNRTVTQEPSSQKAAFSTLKDMDEGKEGATVVGAGELNVGDKLGIRVGDRLGFEVFFALGFAVG